MSQINRLQTIDADTLQSTAYEPVSFVVDDLLPQGLHLLAGAPKIGKSWLALWLYMSGQILILGAELSAALIHRKKHTASPPDGEEEV